MLTEARGDDDATDRDAAAPRALARGGDDFLIKPVRPAYLLAAVKARAWRARRARADFESLRGGDR